VSATHLATVSQRSDPDRERLERFLLTEWPAVRKRGREHFVWRHRVLPIGLPTAAIVAAWAFWELGFSARDLMRIEGIALAYISLIFGAGIFYFFARLEWNERERKYRKNRGDGDENPK
jgi:hypothetical protein